MPKGKEKSDQSQNKKTCSVTALAELFGCTVRYVNELVKDHVIPAPLNHRYDYIECTHAYITSLKGRGASKKSKVDEEIKQIKLDRERFDFDVEKGKYIPKDQVINELVRRIHVLKSDLLSLEKRMPAGSKEKETVKKYVRNLLKTYSQRSGAFKDSK